VGSAALPGGGAGRLEDRGLQPGVVVGDDQLYAGQTGGPAASAGTPAGIPQGLGEDGSAYTKHQNNASLEPSPAA